jgi:hypothetical protein
MMDALTADPLRGNPSGLSDLDSIYVPSTLVRQGQETTVSTADFNEDIASRLVLTDLSQGATILANHCSRPCPEFRCHSVTSFCDRGFVCL